MVDDASKTLLVVDDNARVLQTLTRIATRAGFHAVPFATLGEALEQMAASPNAPAAGIIDIFLERGRQGFELCEFLRERFGTSMPIAMITNYDPGGLPPPYWAASKEETGDAISHFDAERIPVYEKPVDGPALQPLLVRAATVGWLQRSPAVLRDGVVRYAVEHQLTPQEARIVAHLAAGSTRSSLAQDLGLSRDTIKSQMRRLLEKCGVNSTDELIAALLRQISSAEFCEPSEQQ